MIKSIQAKRERTLANISHSGVALMSVLLTLIAQLLPGFMVMPMDGSTASYLGTGQLLARILGVNAHFRMFGAGLLVVAALGLIIGCFWTRMVSFCCATLVLLGQLLMMYGASKTVLSGLLRNPARQIPFMQLGPTAWVAFILALVLLIATFSAAFDSN